MHGLIRVRQFTISEGHLILRPDQLEEEFKGCLQLANDMLTTLGLYEDVSYRFSQWDPDDREKYIGTPEQWDEAQGAMKKILDNIGLDYEIGIDEAAFYGPKLDIQIKNVFGKEDTLITIQIDQMLAEQFDMDYVDRDGVKESLYHPQNIYRLLRENPCLLYRKVCRRIPYLACSRTDQGAAYRRPSPRPHL